jgi:hypothetical protein
MAAVGEVDAVVGVVADLVVVSADPDRSTKQTAMAMTTSRSAPVSLFTPADAATTALHPNVVERLLAVRERADTLHRAVVPHSERSEANTAKIAAANRLRQLEAPPPEGYNLHPEDRRLLAQREQVEQLTVEWQRLEAQNEPP